MPLRGIKAVSFDLDGTLVSREFADYFWLDLVPELYAKRHGLQLKEAKELVLRMYEEVGPDDIRWYMPEYWFNKFSLPERPAEVLESIKHKVKVLEGALELLQSLRDKYTLVVASNASRIFMEVELKTLGPGFFKRTFSCVSDYGLPRKYEAFYLSICKELSLRPAEVLHIGDDEKYDYLTPRAAGLNAYLIVKDGLGSGREHAIANLKELVELLG